MNKYSKSNYKQRKIKRPKYNKFKKRQLIIKKKTPFLLKNKWSRLVILIIILILSLSYLLLLSPAFKINKTEIIAPNNIALKPLQDILKAEMGKKRFNILSGQCLLLFNKKNAQKAIMANVPEIKEAEITKRFPKTLILEVKKREPILIWCFQGDNNCFLVDRDRIIFKKAVLELPLPNNLNLLKDEQPKKNILEQACKPRDMENILEIKNFLTEKLDIKINNFIKYNKGKLDVITVNGWAMYFDLNSDIRLALTKLKLLLDNEIPLKQRKNLKYIDLRYSKIYYK